MHWFWKNERDKFGYVFEEKVQLYELHFSIKNTDKRYKDPYKTNLRVLVVCNTVEDAIALCRKQWPEGFVLHQIVKRNPSCDLIVDDAVFNLAEGVKSE
jgi:CRISPR/Cas system-associated endonuclease/helicase Cas3